MKWVEFAGIAMWVFPAASEQLDRRRHEWEGIASDFGPRYRDGLKMRAAFVIGCGVVLALIPLIAP